MNAAQVIYDHLNGDFLAGDAFLCLQLAVSLNDADKATQAGMRCMDLARQLKAKQRADVHPDFHEAVKEIRSGVPNSAMSAVISPSVATPGVLQAFADSLPDMAICSWCGSHRPNKPDEKGCDKCNPTWLRESQADYITDEDIGNKP